MTLEGVPPISGGEEDVSRLPTSLRLSDAEGIAAQRLDEADAGSLQKALANVAAASAVDDRAPASTEAGEGVVDQCDSPQPLVRLIEARMSHAGGAPADIKFSAYGAMPRLPPLELGIVLATPVEPPHVLGPAEPDPAGDITPAPTPGPDTDGQSLAADEPDEAAQPSPVPLVAEPAIAPLASALDAAVRLAADASVAAEALENLKRLLEHKQELESHLPDPASLTAARPTHPSGASAAGAHVSASVPAAQALENLRRLLEQKQVLESRLSDPASLAAARPPHPSGASASGAHVLASVPALVPAPPPLPLHAQQSDEDRDDEPTMLPPPPRQFASERRGLDVRGFLAGFALSWAFGAVLYLFLTAG
jgi:hypothetical protein